MCLITSTLAHVQITNCHTYSAFVVQIIADPLMSVLYDLHVVLWDKSVDVNYVLVHTVICQCFVLLLAVSYIWFAMFAVTRHSDVAAAFKSAGFIGTCFWTVHRDYPARSTWLLLMAQSEVHARSKRCTGWTIKKHEHRFFEWICNASYTVVPVPFLKGEKAPLKVENYRPVSLTCSLRKLLERMENAFTWCLEKHGHLTAHTVSTGSTILLLSLIHI